MLFNSYEFIFAFLPLVYVVYRSLAKLPMSSPRLMWLTGASLFFYGFWDIRFVPILVLSIGFNYVWGYFLLRCEGQKSKQKNLWLVTGLVANLSLLGFFKYRNFAIENANFVLGTTFESFPRVLPLAISFFTFQQIAYLVDASRGLVLTRPKWMEFTLFVSFFPQLIAGPIVHHRQIMPQFGFVPVPRDWQANLAVGMTRFGLGLFKKIVIADFFANFANMTHADPQSIHMLQAWLGVLSYALQIYYDFSGYSDMAIGASRMFGIALPENFNSPYKAVHLQDLWKRWHMTLSQFFRDYVYIPLGGNQVSTIRNYGNIFCVFLLSGLWHGANWNMIIWGALHGLGTIGYLGWSKLGIRLPLSVAKGLTFLYTALAFVFFRADSTSGALTILSKLLPWPANLGSFFADQPSVLNAFAKGTSLIQLLFHHPVGLIILSLTVGFVLSLTFKLKNSRELIDEGIYNHRKLFTILIAVTVLVLVLTNTYWQVADEFIYFQF